MLLHLCSSMKWSCTVPVSSLFYCASSACNVFSIMFLFWSVVLTVIAYYFYHHQASFPVVCSYHLFMVQRQYFIYYNISIILCMSDIVWYFSLSKRLQCMDKPFLSPSIMMIYYVKLSPVVQATPKYHPCSMLDCRNRESGLWWYILKILIMQNSNIFGVSCVITHMGLTNLTCTHPYDL
jgi:hypothetical protein